MLAKLTRLQDHKVREDRNKGRKRSNLSGISHSDLKKRKGIEAMADERRPHPPSTLFTQSLYYWYTKVDQTFLIYLFSFIYPQITLRSCHICVKILFGHNNNNNNNTQNNDDDDTCRYIIWHRWHMGPTRQVGSEIFAPSVVIQQNISVNI